MKLLWPQNASNVSEYSIPLRKLEFPVTLEIVFDKCKQHNDASIATNIRVKVVGMNPARWKVSGRFSMAGPVNELTAIDTDPRYPILPTCVDHCSEILLDIWRNHFGFCRLEVGMAASFNWEVPSLTISGLKSSTTSDEGISTTRFSTNVVSVVLSIYSLACWTIHMSAIIQAFYTFSAIDARADGSPQCERARLAEKNDYSDSFPILFYFVLQTIWC